MSFGGLSETTQKLRRSVKPRTTAGIHDITVRKEAEKHLVQMEARYQGLMEAAPDGMVVVNEAGEIVLLNALAEKQFGYHRYELLGQRVTNIIPEGFAERLIADAHRTSAEALAQQIGTGIELSGLRKDGTRFPIEIMLSPLESPDGILVTAAIRDITVRKKAERHLARMMAQISHSAQHDSLTGPWRIAASARLQCCFWIWMVSNTSTIPWVIQPETSFFGPSQSVCRVVCVLRTP
jgi:PAS domain S-box-containing protein